MWCTHILETMLSHPTTIFPEHVCHSPLEIDSYLPLISVPVEENPIPHHLKPVSPGIEESSHEYQHTQKAAWHWTKQLPAPLSPASHPPLSYTRYDTGSNTGVLLFSSSEEAELKMRPLTFTESPAISDRTGVLPCGAAFGGILLRCNEKVHFWNRSCRFESASQV